MNNIIEQRTARSPVAELRDEDLTDEDGTCQLIGGELTPIHRSTLWRGIAAGRYPKPLKIGPSLNRWKVGEVRGVVAAAAAARETAAA